MTMELQGIEFSVTCIANLITILSQRATFDPSSSAKGDSTKSMTESKRSDVVRRSDSESYLFEPVASQDSAASSEIVKVCRCRPDDGGAADAEGRRTQTSKGDAMGRRRGYCIHRC
jgi:hypothetical protein